MGRSQGFERGVPGVSEHHKPDDPGHEGVVDDDKDDDTRQRFCGPANRRHCCVTGILQLAHTLNAAIAGPEHLRGLSKPHGVVTLAYNLLPCSIHELSKPANAANEEAGIDVEQNDGRVAVGILPVGKECGL